MVTRDDGDDRRQQSVVCRIVALIDYSVQATGCVPGVNYICLQIDPSPLLLRLTAMNAALSGISGRPLRSALEFRPGEAGRCFAQTLICRLQPGCLRHLENRIRQVVLSSQYTRKTPSPGGALNGSLSRISHKAGYLEDASSKIVSFFYNLRARAG